MKPKKISVRAKKYIKNKIAGMSDYKAAISAGYKETTAHNAAKNIEKQGIKELIDELMDRKGLTDERLIDSLVDGLNNSNKIHGYEDNFVEIPDYAIRHKYLETALKLKNKFPASKQDITSNGKEISPVLVKFIDNANDRNTT